MPSKSRHRLVLAVGVAVVIALIAGLVWLQTAGSTPRDAGGTQSPITVASLQNDVLLRAGGTEFQTVDGMATTTSGSTIRTSSTGRALITSASSHTTLVDYSSEVTLAQDAGNHTRVGLLTGAVWSRLEKVFDSGEYYEIKTGNAVAAVRGTSFGVWYAGDTTTLIVTDGSVLFSSIDPVTEMTIPDTGVLVTAGQKAVRIGTGKITVGDASSEDLARPWLVFNTGKDVPVSPATQPVSPPTPTGPVQSPAAASPVPGAAPSSTAQTTQPSGTSQQPPSEPRLSSLSPSTVEAASGTTITLKGSALENVLVVEIGSLNVSFKRVSATTITFTSEDVGPGTYDIKVSARGGMSDVLSRALTVTAPRLKSPNSAP